MDDKTKEMNKKFISPSIKLLEEVPSEKSKRGKKSRAAGQKFEIKVREDLEKKGWIVSKWINTVDYDKNKIVSAKRKYNPFSKILTIGVGFPDFICFKRIDKKEEEETIEGTSIPEEYIKKDNKEVFDVIGLEVKSNGYLDQIEKGMCIWYLENKIFSRILIARKSRGGKEMNRKSISPAIKLLEEGKGIEYIDFIEKYNKK
jgi:hypothetical protein